MEILKKSKMKSHELETILRFLILLLLMVFVMNALSACSHTIDKSRKSAQNFCFLDFDAKMCWIDKEANQGISFDRMAQANRVCTASDEENALCYYGINSDDMYDIMEIIYFKGNMCK
ncbi:MAG: hypothetical protein BWY19_00761 [bacterium ADurb.Bin212]|nr:MAG: hypothetical protein BWY19_00761 [bacterium ADurb.Bin212]